MYFSKNFVGLFFIMTILTNMASADEATKSNRYNYARSELIRLEKYCGVTHMIAHDHFQIAPRVTNANIISDEEIMQFEARIEQLQNCVPQTQKEQSSSCRISTEKLIDVPAKDLAGLLGRYVQIGMTTTVVTGSAPGFFNVTAVPTLPQGGVCD